MTIDAIGGAGAATAAPTTNTARVQMLQQQQRLQAQIQDQQRIQDRQEQVQRERQIQDQQKAQTDLRARADEARLAADRAERDRVRQQQIQTPNVNGRTDVFA